MVRLLFDTTGISIEFIFIAPPAYAHPTPLRKRKRYRMVSIAMGAYSLYTVWWQFDDNEMDRYPLP